MCKIINDYNIMIVMLVILFLYGIKCFYCCYSKDIKKYLKKSRSENEVIIEVMTDNNCYIINRLDNQQKWHSTKSSNYLDKYDFTQYVNYISLALIPLVNLVEVDCNETLSVILSVIAGLACFAEKNGEYKKKWLLYRMISEELKKEKQLYLNKADYYADADVTVLVSRCENIISRANNEWFCVMDSDKNQDK